jgi:hypothetical protein
VLKVEIKVMATKIIFKKEKREKAKYFFKEKKESNKFGY